MNQRMKELAEQLGYNVNFEPSIDETDREYQVVSNDFAEKFAELIVKECAEVVYSRSGHARPQDLLEHFGVEE